MATREELLTLLTRHQGADRGISVEGLAMALHVSERQVRKLVSAAREAGFAIAAMPEHGYFIPVSPTELEECCRFLRSRAMHSLMLESRLRKVPLADLIGQMRLPT